VALHATTIDNFDGDNIEQRLALQAESQWRNFWSTELVARLQPETYDDRLTRGGPLALRPASRGVDFSLRTDGRRAVSWDFSYDVSANDADGWSQSFGIELEARPTSAVQLSVEPEISREYNTAQFVTSVSDALASETFGRRYIFGDIEQRELSISTRVAWTFSPKLSLQVFAQPLVSSGRFDRYKEFRTPGTFAFDVYGRDRGSIVRDRATQEVRVDPDGAGMAPTFQFDEEEFTVRALRGNAVLRWEYRPGSTIFLVWQQVREDETPVADLQAAMRPGDAFRVAAHNVFLIKASYWFGR
jgi:hypothetical protein